MQIYWILMYMSGYLNLDFGGNLEFLLNIKSSLVAQVCSLTLTLFFTSVNSILVNSLQKPEDSYSISAHVSTCTHKYSHTLFRIRLQPLQICPYLNMQSSDSKNKHSKQARFYQQSFSHQRCWSSRSLMGLSPHTLYSRRNTI